MATETKHAASAMDKVAMWLGGGLILLGLVVMGFINTVAGSMSPLYEYELTKGGEVTTGHVLQPGMAPQGAEIVTSPVFDPNLRAWIITLGLLVWGVYAVYKLVTRGGVEATEERAAPTPQ